MRPMLAEAVPEELGVEPFLPALVSAKIDGMRALVKDGVVWSKTLERVPNEHVQRVLGRPEFEGLDGELTVGPPYDSTGTDNVIQRTLSGCMSRGGTPEFTFYVFDFHSAPVAPATPYAQRLAMLEQAFAEPFYAGHPRVELLTQYHVTDPSALADLQEDHLERGYEGLILRNPAGLYKFGRSTTNPPGATRGGKAGGKVLQEWVMLKLKRFSDGEARVVGGEEMMHNLNDLDENALGLAKRSTSREGLVPAGVLGTLIGEDVKSGLPIRVGTGFTAEQRAALWSQLPQLVAGRALFRYKHFEVGVKNAPRHAVFSAFVHPMTIGEAP